MIDPLDNLVRVNFAFIQQSLALFLATRLFNSGVKASLSSVNVLADNVRLVSSANTLGTASSKELGDDLMISGVECLSKINNDNAI